MRTSPPSAPTGCRSPTYLSGASATARATTARPADPTSRSAVAADPAPLLSARFPAGTDVSGELLALLARPTIADKSWISRQYDHQLFLNTVVGPGSDAAVLRLPEARRALALEHRRQARFAALDPRTGARLGARGGAQRGYERRPTARW